ncbi:HAD family hydrolase [Chitinophaga sedimenti]|uniref:HAD family hydrolase n=1 Tax=Chitinophaga sedimenti TaxID=2033606 RepID=UPI002003C4BE|nr:HAD family hydrolase [Chitinophaga sedimenti]MCK7554173.1 HAD family hydrolase [Chitinophaga sedimenti]
MHEIQHWMVRKPFAVVAQLCGISAAVTAQAVQLLQTLRYTDPLSYFPDYAHVRDLPVDKFLVTAGFTGMQQSKISKLGIAGDFREIVIVDATLSNATKKTSFAYLSEKYSYPPAAVMVIGDDPGSEIKAALELGMRAVLYDRTQVVEVPDGAVSVADFSGIGNLLE